MSATPKQIAYINDIMEAGCPIPQHPQFDRPDDSMFASVEAADAFIKANRHWCYRNPNPAKIAQHSTVLREMSDRTTPDEWCVPNH